MQLDDGVLVDSQSLYVPTPQQSLAPAAGPTFTQTHKGVEFHAAPSALTWNVVSSCLYATAANSAGNSFKMPLQLPNGAQVTGLTLYAIDNNADFDIVVSAVRANPANYPPTKETLTAITTTGSSASMQSVTVTGAPLFTVDNTTYAYFLRYQPTDKPTGTPAFTLCGMRITYSLSTVYFPAVKN